MGVNTAVNAVFISGELLAKGADGAEDGAWGIAAVATAALESPAAGSGVDTTIACTGTFATMIGIGVPAAVGPCFRCAFSG
jgi:hypothetical protein